ncbi:MAG: hypothetical protein EOP05_16970, partial [Proteobacteria bacterium]
ENAIPAHDKDKRIKIVYPEDGVIIQNNALAIIKKKESRATAEKVADWFFHDDGQAAMVRGYMYATVPGKETPKGAKPLSEVMAKAQKWDQSKVEEFMNDREEIKEQFMNIMLQ